jgi:hypothetical protein
MTTPGFEVKVPSKGSKLQFALSSIYVSIPMVTLAAGLDVNVNPLIGR